MNIRARIMGLVGLFLALVLGVGLSGIWSASQAQERLLEAHERISAAEMSALLTELAFERQEKAWKNLLLRGHNEDDLDRYWAEFVREERATRREVGKLLETLPADSVSARVAETFLHDHGQLGDRHRDALVVFTVGGEGAQLRGDGLVRGTDQTIDRAFGEIARVLAQDRVDMEETVRSIAMRHGISAASGLLICALLGFVVIGLALHHWLDYPLLSIARRAGKPAGAADRKSEGRQVRFKAPQGTSGAVALARATVWKRVLLVEREGAERRLLETELEGQSCEVRTAASVSEALCLLDALEGGTGGCPVDLVVAASEVPGMTGGALRRFLRASPATCALPLLLHGAEGDGAGEQAGGDALTRVLEGSDREALLQVATGVLGDPEDGGSAALVPIDPAAEFPRCRAARFLVAEDEAMNRKYMGLMLGKVGAEFGQVENGEEAVEQSLRGDYTVILMDCSMPVMDGYEATRRIRAAQGEAVIVGVTAHADDQARRKCLEAGMDAMVTKPVKLEYLCLVIEEQLARRAEESGGGEES